MRLSSLKPHALNPLLPRYIQLTLGLIALIFTIVLCANNGWYYETSSTSLLMSSLFAFIGLLIFGAQGLFAAKQRKDPQWLLQTLIVDCLALLCSVIAVTCITIDAGEIYYGMMGYWLPPMLCVWFIIFIMLYLVIRGFNLRRQSTPSAAIQADKDIEQPGNWYIPEPEPEPEQEIELQRPQHVSITYGNGHVTFKIPESAIEMKDNRSLRAQSEVGTAAHWSTASGQVTLAQPSIMSSESRAPSRYAPSYTSDIAKDRTNTYAET